ncbi:WD40/YVTN/BNR-like repeat-containing protein [Rivibacter subsaxonicus]|uniref:Photosystem II stability/assembly factor-like uncharacterized protein n=1 Tax=Rivibacter subsaxonicus TaxID=457575 RepID=A0A4Q7VZT6_9BURK|nr:YCF48-related protein [Rivibacter subsaxonicus]RZU02411.1 photosystem II stability/assembly factor-like uncharacterized protein [Rivibacter subsaxonicus]
MLTDRRRLLGFALAGAAVCTLTRAAGGAAAGWRDVLDTPALPSVLAPRALVGGLARAGSRIVAVGQRGHVLWSDDEGRSWTQAQVPVSSDLVAVCFSDHQRGWAVGHDGVVLHSADAGRSWTLQLDGRRSGALMVEHYEKRLAAGVTPAEELKRIEAALAEARRFAEQGAENPLLDVWFESPSTGFVVGAFGQVLRTTDGGAHWEPWLHAVDNPKGLHLYAVAAVGDALFIVGEQGLALRLDREKSQFRAIELPYKGTLFGLTGNERALVAHGLRGSLLRSTDGGTNWAVVPSGLQVGLTASTRGEDGTLFVVSQAGHVLASRDDGASFRPVPQQRPQPTAAVVASGKSALVLGGPRGIQGIALP